jgi:hypothetical protein
VNPELKSILPFRSGKAIPAIFSFIAYCDIIGNEFQFKFVPLICWYSSGVRLLFATSLYSRSIIIVKHDTFCREAFQRRKQETQSSQDDNKTTDEAILNDNFGLDDIHTAGLEDFHLLIYKGD